MVFEDFAGDGQSLWLPTLGRHKASPYIGGQPPEFPKTQWHFMTVVGISMLPPQQFIQVLIHQGRIALPFELAHDLADEPAAQLHFSLVVGV